MRRSWFDRMLDNKPMLWIVVIVGVAFLAACAPIVKQTHSLQPAVTSDSPSLWLQITTDDEKLNGVYRCTSDASASVICRKAKLE